MKAWLFSKWCSKYLSVTTSVYIYFIMRMCLVRNNYCYSYNRWETPNIYIGTWELCKLNSHLHYTLTLNGFIYIYNGNSRPYFLRIFSKKSVPVAWPGRWVVVFRPSPTWKMMDDSSLGMMIFSIPKCFWKVIKFHGSKQHQPLTINHHY